MTQLLERRRAEVQQERLSLIRECTLPAILTMTFAALLFLSPSLLLLLPAWISAKQLDIVFSFLFGASASMLLVAYASWRARTELRNLSRETRSYVNGGESPPPRLTGLAFVDSILFETRRTVDHFLDLIATLGDKLEDIADRYDLLTTNLAASVIIRNVDGQVVFCSPYTEVLTGYNVEEFIESEEDFFESLVLASDRNRFHRAKLVSVLGEDIAVRFQLRHKSGIILWVETHLVPICDLDGQIESVLAVSIDVTASVRYQQRIEEQNRDLNDFTYMVSHDLKAPIFTIKGMASVLVEDLGDKLEGEAKESISHIIEAANRLEVLVKSVIEYSSLSSKEISEDDVYLDRVLDEVVNDFAVQARDKRAVIECQKGLPVVRGEHLRLYQVFANLVGNALKYSSPERAPIIKIFLAGESGDRVSIGVSDNGLGVPTSKIQDIFRPYHRAHGREIEGSGIGLACVKKIVERLGGAVSVSSTEGQGSTFTVTFRPSHSTDRQSTVYERLPSHPEAER